MSRVHVVIPAFNRAAVIGRAIKSALEQTERPASVVVVDDASTDGTEAAVRAVGDPLVHYVRHDENLGGGGARNTGLSMATSEYVAFLDSDDEWLPHHLERSVICIEQEKADGVFSSFVLDDGGARRPYHCAQFAPGDDIVEYILGEGGGDPRSSTFVFKTDVFRQIKFDSLLRKHQDWDVAIRFVKNGRLISKQEPSAVLHIEGVDRMSMSPNPASTSVFLDRHMSSMSGSVAARVYSRLMFRSLKQGGLREHFRLYRRSAVKNWYSATPRVKADIIALSIPIAGFYLVRLREKLRSPVRGHVQPLSINRSNPLTGGDPLSILQVITRQQKRGAEMFANALSQYMVSSGHQVSVLGLHSPIGEVPREQGVKYIDLDTNDQRMFSVSIVRELATAIKDIQPDVIQANGGYAMKYTVLARQLARSTAKIVYCNIGISSDWLQHIGQRSWNRWLLRQVDHVAAVAEIARDDLMEAYKLPSNSVTTIRRGVDLDPVFHYDEGRQALALEGISTDAPVLLHVGQFSWEKNHPGLIRIFKRLRQAWPNLHLVLVGGGNEKPPGIEREYGVRVLGYRDDVPLLMAGSDIFVLPSVTEGIPGVVLEAGVQALPCVAYNVGGLSEVVKDGRNGFLVAMGDEDAAVGRIDELLRSKALRDRMGGCAQEFIFDNYVMERSARTFEQLYRTCVESSSMPSPISR